MAHDRWVTFDCFGTLVDWRTGYRRALTPIAGSRTEALMNAYHDFERSVEAQRPHRLYKDVLVTALELGARQIGLRLPEGRSDVLVREWRAMPFFADVAPALAALRGAGWKLAMLTNCDNELFAGTLEHFPLRPDLVVTAEMVQSYKPELGHFARFEQETRVERANWIHAACSWFHDIAPARRYGVRRVWVDRDRTGDDPAAATRTIPNLVDLPKTIAEIAAQPASDGA